MAQGRLYKNGSDLNAIARNCRPKAMMRPRHRRAAAASWWN